MRTIPFLAVLALLAACDVEITGLSDGEAMVLRVDVSGGIAAADYTFQVEDDGSVLGLRCVNMCDFVPGDTVARLTPAQRNAVRAEVVASGLPTAGRPVDFGTECCDQFTYRVIYTSGAAVRSFTGGVASFPEPLRRLVRMLHLLYLETPPLIVSQTKGLEGFTLDPLVIRDARVVAGILEVDVTFGGGCGQHDLDAVAYTTWMESDPVEVGVAVTHDPHGDSCEAAVQRTLLFDLEPLKDAYTDAYGTGNADLVLRVEPGAGAPGDAPRLLTYSF
jgi:hypothetical protein